MKSLPDISKWNINNVTDMSGLFSECSSLEFLPNISKWNISKVRKIEKLFMNCSSLLSLPDISIWNTINIENINDLFSGCKSLISIPDISIWKTDNLKIINNIFKGCSSLLSAPDISKWNFHNIKVKINTKDIIEEVSSNQNSIERNIISSDSENINSSDFLNNEEKIGLIDNKEYKYNNVEFFPLKESLSLYYENFYQDL